MIAACIYCGKSFDTLRGKGDHVIPAALGRFVGEFRFRQICSLCNNDLRRCDDQLLRCGPEALFKRFVKIKATEKKRGTSPVGADGQPPPRYTIKREGHYELAEPAGPDPMDLRLVDQLVVIGEDAKEHHIRLRPGMSEDALRAKIRKAVPGRVVRSYWHCDAANHAEYIALIKKMFPESTIGELPSTEPGKYTVQGRTYCTFHADYFRALAKIAFHYYLCISRRGLTGTEPEFAEIRAFIRDGGDHRPFFERPGPRIALPFGVRRDGQAVLPSQWIHLLAADESTPLISVALDLFIGPKRPPSVHNIQLARLRSPLIVPGYRTIHTYVYEAESTPEGWSGRVETHAAGPALLAG